MNDEKKLHEQILLLSFEKQVKIHIALKDGTWRNGFVKGIRADFFLFEDKENGVEPIFFLELKKIDPYYGEGK